MDLTDNIDGSTNSRKRERALFTRLFSNKSTRSTDANRQLRNNTPKVKLVIHHQFPGIELVSPVYACDGATCILPPDQRVNVGSTMQTGFNINFFRKGLFGILMYELRSTKQFNKNAIYSEDEATCTQLFIIWKINDSKEFLVISYMIEHDKGYIWDKNNLMRLAKQYKLYDIQHVPVGATYLMRDNTVLMTRMNVIREGKCHKLEMTISGGSIKDDTWRPKYIDVDR
jgi:hypothetical protein